MTTTKTSTVLIEIVWEDGSTTGMNIGALSREDVYEFDLKLNDLSEGLFAEFRHWYLEEDQELGDTPDNRGSKYLVRNDGYALVVETWQIPKLSELYFQGELVLLRYKGELLNLMRLNSLSRLYLGTNTSFTSTVSKLYPILRTKISAELEEKSLDKEKLFDAICSEMNLSKSIVWPLLKGAEELSKEDVEIEEEASIEDVDTEADALGLFEDKDDA